MMLILLVNAYMLNNGDDVGEYMYGVSYVHASYVVSDITSILPLTGSLYPYSR
jgi:hypothetical protein